jgi:hypothetical protein
VPAPQNLIDICARVETFLDSLEDLRTSVLLLCIDLEAVYLVRLGTASIIQLIPVHLAKQMYRIIIYTLSKGLLYILGTSVTTLKDILESEYIPEGLLWRIK